MKNKNLLILSLFLLVGVAGCATGPVKETLTTYSIRGVQYVPLVELCSKKGVAWEFDAYSRTVALRKNAHTIKLRVGETMVLVDGKSSQMEQPMVTHQGMISVPMSFKEKILDPLLSMPAAYIGRSFSTTKIRKIVVDAGHGGKDPGTMGRSGLKEKDVNLDIARRVAKLLKDRGAEVLLTRSTDDFIELPNRGRIANRFGADLFLSIHSNANRVRSLNGFEVYYISPEAKDSKRALNAAKDGVPPVARSCVADASPTLKAILWDMVYAANRAESIDLGKDICRIVDRNMESKILGVKSANFQVLRDTRMPAVLVEIGFLSNAGEERQLRNSYYRQQLAESLVQGVQEYAASFPATEASK